MANPLDLLHAAKIEKYNKKEKLQSSVIVTAENLIQEMPVLDYEFLSIDSNETTAVCSTDEYIFIGTHFGEVRIYNYLDTKANVLKPSKKVTGFVTSIDVLNNSHTIAGYSSGHVVLWDLKSCKVLHILTGFSTSILQLKFNQSISSIIALSETVHIISLKKKILKFSSSINSLTDIGQNLISFEILNHSENLDSYLLIISFERLIIFSFKTSTSLFSISSIRPSAIPYCGWIGSSDKYVISISFDSTIVVYNILKEGFNASLCFEATETVCGMKWLKNDILIIITKYSDALVYLFFGRKTIGSHKIRLDSEIRSSKVLLDKIGLPCESFHNSISGNKKTVILGKEKICVIKSCLWKDCLSHLVKKKKWIESLNLGHILLQDLSFSFLDNISSKSEVLKQLEEILIEFIKENQSIQLKEKISWAIEFGVKFGLTELVFNQFFAVLFGSFSIEKFDVFIQELRPFLFNGVIRSIPSEGLNKIITYLIETKNFDTIEDIILHLDSAHLDSKTLTPICDEHTLINAYIYLSTQSNMQSFVNPLKKLYKLVRKTKDSSQRQYYLYNLLWYLRLCFYGQTFPHNDIRSEIKEEVLIKTISWLIKSNHLKQLFEIDISTTLSVLRLIFIEKSVKSCIEKQKSITFREIIQKLESFIKVPSLYLDELIIFIIQIQGMTSFKLSRESVIIISKFLIGKSPVHNSEVSNEANSALVLSLLKSNKPYNQSEITELLKLARSSRYVEILSFIYQLLEDYDQAILCYIQSDNFNIRARVFLVIEDILKWIKTDQISSFKEVLIKYLSELAEIDTDNVGKIVTQWFHNEHSLTISKLSSAPGLQLKYLSDLLRNSGSVDEKMVLLYIKLLCEYDPHSVMGFLKSSEDYSYDECLKIVVQYRIIEAIAYMHEKLGSIKEAILVIINFIEDVKYSILKTFKSDLLQVSTFIDLKNNIEIALEICQRNSPVFEEIEYDENWFILLNKCLDIYTDLTPVHQKHLVLNQILDECIKNVMKTMILNVDFDKLLGQITKNHGTLPFQHFRESTIMALSRFSYTVSIVGKANSLLLKDRSFLTEKLVDNFNQGICSDDFYCMKCKTEIERTSMLNPDDRIVVFECGHTFHSGCIKVRTCEGCRIIENRNKDFFKYLKFKKAKKNY